MRLTEKNIGMAATNDASEKVKKEVAIFNKLHDLENIEEELGIDLVILLKALKNGIYVKDNDLLTFPCLSVKGKMLFTMPTMRMFELKDYGKTWALTKEELL